MQMYIYFLFIRFYQSVLVTDTAWKFLKEGHFRHPSLVLWWCWRLLLDPAQCGVWLGWLQFLGMQQHKKNFTFSPLLYSSAILILLNNVCTKLNSFRSIWTASSCMGLEFYLWNFLIFNTVPSNHNICWTSKICQLISLENLKTQFWKVSRNL